MKKVVILPVLLGVVLCGCNSSKSPDSMDIMSNSAAMINGKLDNSEAHRAVVAFRTKGESHSTFCTGTLIAPDYVLTAAHCFGELASRYKTTPSKDDPQCKWEATASFQSFTSGWRNSVVSIGNSDEETARTQYAIDKVTIPKDYAELVISTGCDRYGDPIEEGMTINDIALVKLKKPIPGSVAKPIPVLPPWLGQNDELYADNMNAEFVGFGFNEKGEIGYKLTFTRPMADVCKYQKVDKEGRTRTDICRYKEHFEISACHPSPDYCSYYGWVNEEYDSLPYYPGTMLYFQDDGGPCQGDSGGPAFVTIGGQEYLAGITSYGDSACAGYGISTDVQSFYYSLGLDSIQSVTDQFVEICGNGIDDDGNGLTDDADDDCGSCPATFTFHDPYTNLASGGTADFDVYLVGSFNTNPDGSWIVDDDKYKMTSDGNGTHTITIEYPKNASFEYKYHVKGWVDADSGRDDGWKSDDPNDGDAIAMFNICGKRYGVGANESYCGNGVWDENEFCDNKAFPDVYQSCADVDPSYVSGRLKCNLDCTLDLSDCSTEEAGGIGNGSSNENRTSLPDDPDATNGMITLDSIMKHQKPTGLPEKTHVEDTDAPSEPVVPVSPDEAGDSGNSDTPSAPDDVDDGDDVADGQNMKNDSGDDCSAMPLNPSHSGALALLLGLGALLGLRRRKEN